VRVEQHLDRLRFERLELVFSAELLLLFSVVASGLGDVSFSGSLSVSLSLSLPLSFDEPCLDEDDSLRDDSLSLPP